MLCIKWVIQCLNARLQNMSVFWEWLPPIRCDLGGIQQELVLCSRLCGATSSDEQENIKLFLGEKPMCSVWTNERPYNQGGN